MLFYLLKINKINKILLLYPLGLYNLCSFDKDYLKYLFNSSIINCNIGPIYNLLDIELGSKYYIYCKITNNKDKLNILGTNFLKNLSSNFNINGQMFIIKVNNNYLVDITLKDFNYLNKIFNEKVNNCISNIKINYLFNNIYKLTPIKPVKKADMPPNINLME